MQCALVAIFAVVAVHHCVPQFPVPNDVVSIPVFPFDIPIEVGIFGLVRLHTVRTVHIGCDV